MHRGTEIVGSGPLDTVVQDLLDIFIVEGTARFMTGLEVEDLAASAVVGTAGTEDPGCRTDPGCGIYSNMLPVLADPEFPA